MQQKLRELTDTIYQEGVQKGEARAAEIVAEAQESARRALDDARREAEGIVAAARENAAEIKRNAESEIKLAGEQALGALRLRIEETVTATALDTPLRETLSDPDVLVRLLSTMVGNWQSSSPGSSLEVLLPQDQRTELEKSLKGAVAKVLAKGVDFTWSRSLRSGFQIREQGNGYKVSLTDDDFSEFIKEFIRPRTKAYLFGG